MNHAAQVTCIRCGATPLPSLDHPHGCVENGYFPPKDAVFVRAAARHSLPNGRVEVVGVLGEDESLLDNQPQAIEDAIVYAKWACVDWTRVIVRVGGRCVGIAKVPDGQRGEPKGVWFGHAPSVSTCPSPPPTQPPNLSPCTS
jgi:hypothetical protein